jgi:pyruvate/2-oxoglutarate dehydrogenase complex dihydrolipoamide acyltransferase (E2) component
VGASDGSPAARRHRFRVRRLPPSRDVVIDLVRLAAGQATIHGLIEVDVTGLRAALAGQPGRPTVTGFVTSVLGRAVAACPDVNVRRAGRHVISFEDVDVVVSVERQLRDGFLPVPVVISDVPSRSPAEVTALLRAARDRAIRGPADMAGTSALRHLPPVLRRWGARRLSRLPAAAARFGPPVGVTSLGMFGAGWGIPLSPLTVMLTIGGVNCHLVLVDGVVAEHDFLPLTLSFDHTVIDGAVAARFAQTFRQLLEAGAAATALPTTPPAAAPAGGKWTA